MGTKHEYWKTTKNQTKDKEILKINTLENEKKNFEICVIAL